jgi:glutamate dehydrogenase
MLQNKTSFSYLTKNNNYLVKIINMGTVKYGELFEKFVHFFYANAVIEIVSNDDVEKFYEIAASAFEFCEIRKNKQNKINIFENLSNNEVEQETIIQVLTDDSPFIVDSIESAIRNLGFEIKNTIHPILHITRNNEGKITEFANNKEAHVNHESCVNIIVEHIEDKGKLTYLIEKVEEALNYVKVSVTDWKETSSLMSNVAEIYHEEGKTHEEKKEIAEFLSRLESKYFVFLGVVKFNVKYDRDIINLTKDTDSLRGILKLDNALLGEVEHHLLLALGKDKKFDLNVGKLDKKSLVHRPANLDLVAVNSLKNQNEVIVFIGLFTSILYFQSATLIPLVRKKVSKVLELANMLPSSHLGKELISIIQSLPRDELFQITAQDLYNLVMDVFALSRFPSLKLYANKKLANTLATYIVFFPVERASSKTSAKIRDTISKYFGEIVNTSYININESKICYFSFNVKLSESGKAIENYDIVEKELAEYTALWSDLLKQQLHELGLSHKFKYYLSEYGNFFPESYKERYGVTLSTIDDIRHLDNINDENQIIFKVVPSKQSNFFLQLKIYCSRELHLSDVIPTIQNMGFVALSEHVFKITPRSNKELWLHIFYLEVKDASFAADAEVILNVEKALQAVWHNEATNDEFNKLILYTNLNFRKVNLLRAIAGYIHQICQKFSVEYAGQILTTYPEIAGNLYHLFHNKFDLLSIDITKRLEGLEKIKKIIKKDLEKVNDPSADRLLNKFIQVIDAMVRTNYFVKDDTDKFKDYLSFKINSKLIPEMPKPIPFMEIYVSSTSFEAIHIRSDKVSRGGLRWSDRFEDYRREVLDLVMAQVPKNCIIVPGGSKGGFVVRRKTNMDNTSYYQYAVESYKNFLRGMLDLTDNIVNDKIISPTNVVSFDEQDPYLVVAADKGTATFSDTANQISKEYNFWLGDAFASGGSAGYDHKKMAITSKGAWISVVRHFHELGINPLTQEFTAIGIGDMAGDVFGNGLLRSNNIKLIAAFNHIHIFVDPNPDSKKSFKERLRLFELKGSTWEDYDSKILSEGGMIYSRKAKMLSLTPQIQKLFDLSVDSITPEDLIKEILKARVDLFWNGGIGTYVKAISETHEQVGDKANDNLRINGCELRCKVISEGGNLGFTQLGRIEYAKNSGLINKDSIDNSAGVDCSDHEVNIKIALNTAVASKKITEDERNNLLEKMTEEVANLVLNDNWQQTLAISITKSRGEAILDSQARLIEILEAEEILNRDLERLPSKKEIKERIAHKEGLTRPEISTLLSYSKIFVYNQVLESDLPNDPFFKAELYNYFPQMMHQKFAHEIENHQLKREIIATVITNNLINTVSTFFVPLTAKETGYSFKDIIKAYIIVREIFDISQMWNDLEKYRDKIAPQDLYKIYINSKKFIMRSTLWLLRNSAELPEIKEVIDLYKPKITSLSSTINQFLIKEAKLDCDTKHAYYVGLNIDENLAKKLSLLEVISSTFNIVHVANETNYKIETIAKKYFIISEIFAVEWLKSNTDSIVATNNWHRLSIKAFKDELYDIQRKLLSAILTNSQSLGDIDEWCKIKARSLANYQSFIEELKKQEIIELSMLDLALRRLKALLLD